MTGSKRPSTSSLRRFITSRPYIPIAELRRRFGLDEPDEVCWIAHNGTSAYVGLPEREATKIGDLWARDEIGVELSVEVHAPVVVGIYPMRIARFVTDGGFAPLNGHGNLGGQTTSNERRVSAGVQVGVVVAQLPGRSTESAVGGQSPPTIMPAPTVLLDDSSMRMKPPVERLRP